MACYYNNTLGTFLGDCFSNHWLEHEDASPTYVDESLSDNVDNITTATTTSQVCVYGDLSVAALPAASFLGGDESVTGTSKADQKKTDWRPRAAARTRGREEAEGGVSSRDVTLTVLQRQLAYLARELEVGGTHRARTPEEQAYGRQRLERVKRMLKRQEVRSLLALLVTKYKY